MSDEPRIESMESKMEKSALQAMDKYKQMQRNMGSLDPDLDVNWLTYSNVMIKICSEIDFDSGDSSDGEDGAEGPKLTTRMKKISTSN